MNIEHPTSNEKQTSTLGILGTFPVYSGQISQNIDL